MTKTFKSRLLGVLISSLVLFTGFFGVSLMNGDNAKIAFAETTCTYENGFCTTHTESDDCYYQACTQNSDGYYEIANGGNMFWFAQKANEVAESNNGIADANKVAVNAIITEQEIDLENKDWTPIGWESYPYIGIFNGNGATIKNLHYNNPNNVYGETVSGKLSRVGFFGDVYNSTIKNLKLYGDITVQQKAGCFGTVAGYVGASNAGSTLENVESYVNLTVNSDSSLSKTSQIGGIAGNCHKSTMRKCAYYGVIDLQDASTDQVGGLVGYTQAGVSNNVVYSAFYGTIKSTCSTALSIGGICGYYRLTSATMSNCLFAGTFEVNSVTTPSAFGQWRQGNQNQFSSLWYYSATDIAVATSDDNTGSYVSNVATKLTKTQLKNGEATYLMNDGVTDGTQVWYQKIDLKSYDNHGDAYPVFSGETVYYTRIGGCTENTYVYGYRNADLSSDIYHTHSSDSFELTETNEDGLYKVSVSCKDCGKVLMSYQAKTSDMIYDGKYHLEKEFYSYDNTDTAYTDFYNNQLLGNYIHFNSVTLYYKAPNAESYGYAAHLKEVGSYQLSLRIERTEGKYYDDDEWRSGGDLAEWTKVSYLNVVPAPIDVTFADYDGTTLSETTIDSTNSTYAAPTYTIPSNDYYTYTFNHWYCEQTGETYTSENLPTYEDLFNAGYTDVTFTAVYDKEYKKGFELDGSIDTSTGLSTSGIYTNGENVKIVETDENGNVTGDVNVYANYAITTNNGVAALLLIPEYDKTKFAISAVSINEQSVYGSGATSNKILLGSDGKPWSVTVTGDEVTADTFKILLEGLPASTATGDLFIQIVYTMAADNVATGEYSFGFITNYPEDTSKITHNDRSEAYGVLKDSEIASFSELRISVNDAKIILVKRQNASIELVNKNVVYDANNVNIYEDCYYKENELEEQIKNELVYHYSAYDTELVNGDTWDWLQYIEIVAWYDKNGTKLDSAPIHVGQYKVGISAKQNDYFNAVEEKQFDFSITPYTIDIEVAQPENKTYNADAQTWVNDTFNISYVDGKAAFEGDTGYNVVVTDNTKDTTTGNYYENGSVVRNWAGKYTVTLTFTATDNYTFKEQTVSEASVVISDDGMTKTVTFEVEILKYAATVSAANKESQYSDDLASLSMGDLLDKDGVLVKDLPGQANVLKLLYTTTATNESECGKYPIMISVDETSSAKDSYEFTFIHNMSETTDGNGNNGTYTITQKGIDLPTVDDLTYNGKEQFPEVTEAATVNGKVAYAFSVDKQINVGEYTLTATLASKNYKWNSETIAADKLDATIDWKIVAATLEITIGKDWTSKYSDELQTIIGTVTGGALLGDDTIDNIGVTYTIDGEKDDNGFLPVGTYTVTGNNSGTNYIITFVDGKYTVTKKVLDDDELQTILANIIGATKEYTGSELTWETKDFTVNGTLNGIAYSDIISITAVAAQENTDYTNANGKLDGDTWTYWDPETKLYYTVSIKVNDVDNYVLYFGENNEKVTTDSVDVEVFIRQATNAWTRGPWVDSTTYEDFATEAEAKFQGEGEVSVVLTDSEGKVVVSYDLVKGEKYVATFTVRETNNYTGLFKENHFEIEGYASTALPTVYLDEENGTIVAPNSSVTITYDGNTHKFVVIPEKENKYTIYISTQDNYASWKNANNLPTSKVAYQITIVLTENYQWDTGDRDVRNYALIIKQASLEITAKSYNVKFGEAIEKYEITADGFVNDETYANYSVEDIGAYFTCEYVAGDQEKGKVGTYPIAYNDGNNDLESLHTLLSNYEVSVVDGEVVVSAYELDLSGLQGKLDEQDAQTWTEFVKGLTVEYNAKTHSISVLGLPDEIEATITYENDTLPVDAGDYSITVSFAIKGELNGVTLNAANYAWDDPSATVTLTITKVHLKLTAYDQRVKWDGDPVYGAMTIEGEKKFEYLGSATDTSFIENEIVVGNVIFDGEYSLLDGQDELVIENILFVYHEFKGNGKAENYEIEKVYATLTIYRYTLTWAIELTTVDRDYNGKAISVGSETSYADYFAKVNVSDYYHNKGEGKLTYTFYTLSGDTYTEISAPKNAGTYYVKAVYTNTIYLDLESDYVSIVISKVSVSVTATAQDRNYLQDLVYGYTSDTMNKFGGKEQSVTYEFSNNNGTTWVSNPQNSWFTVGNYQVKAIVNESTNYQGAESTATFTISEATLKGVKFSYDKDTATWEAITQTIDGEDINKYGDVTVTYTISETPITDNKFTATSTGAFTLKASIDGNENFIGSESTMVEVFSVTFYDAIDNHAKTEYAYDFSEVAPTQYRFSGQYATQPDCCNSNADPITIDGYTFAKKWELSIEQTVYGFTTPVTGNVMLDALWNINVYKVTWMNDNNELATEEYEYLALPSYKGEEPTRDTTDEYAFTFAGWSLTIDGAKVELVEVTEDITYYAFYTKAGVTYAIVFKVSEDGGDYQDYHTESAIAFGTTLTEVYTLADVTWFRGDVWYADEARTQLITTMPVAKNGITVYGGYVFDIGNGDVNADGQITTDDITIYREWVVGGYEMTIVESGSEWTLVHSDGFDVSNKYFIERVADVNADTSMDIRDITTIRMAIVGNYGYEIATGVKQAKVTGEAVRTIYVAPKVELNYTFSEDEDVTLVEQDGKVITVDSTHPPKEDVGNGGVSLPKTSLDLLKIAVSGIDTEYLASGAMPNVKVALYKGEVSDENKYAGSLYVSYTLVDENGNFTIDFGSDYGVEDRTYIMTIDVTYQGITYLQSEFTVTFYKPLTYTFSESQQTEVNEVFKVDVSEDGKTITLNQYDKVAANSTAETSVEDEGVSPQYAVWQTYTGLFHLDIDLGRNLGDGTTTTPTVTIEIVNADGETLPIHYGQYQEDGSFSGKSYSITTDENSELSCGVDVAYHYNEWNYLTRGECTLKITVSYGNFTWKTAEYTLVLENF